MVCATFSYRNICSLCIIKHTFLWVECFHIRIEEETNSESGKSCLPPPPWPSNGGTILPERPQPAKVTEYEQTGNAKPKA